jgi:FMN phosphatase YigB (HAD superfamily)
MTSPAPASGWRGLRAVIFDVDGTMYNQRSLRLHMMLDILRCSAASPARVKDILILRRYRVLRERSAGQALDGLDESLLSATAADCRSSIDKVRGIVREWIHTRPLRHLLACRAPGLIEFINALKDRGVAVAVFSDYPSLEKLRVLGVTVDAAVCSSDATVNSLKPNPRGLLVTCALLGRSPAECMLVGDREDRDGECARQAHVPYLIFRSGAKSSGRVFGSYRDLTSALIRDKAPRAPESPVSA